VPGALAILLRNLVDNAIRYGGPGGHVRVRIESRGGRAVFVVCDDGPGIPASERHSLPGRFRRGAEAGGAGSGLGLAIAARIAELHGGELRLMPGEHARGLQAMVDLPAI
jgi:signal transduction histidine kinase